MPLPEVDPQIKAQGNDVHWYKKDLESVSEPARKLLETYSGVAPENVLAHIFGQFCFLDLSISLSPLYPTILTRLQSGHILLDLGYCFAQDTRKLIADGAPGENIYEAELRQEFIDLGYVLFRDRDRLKSKFIVGDVFDDSARSAFGDVDGRFDIIYAGSFFHLFEWEGQMRLAERVVRLLKPIKGSMVLGRQRGNVHAGEYAHRTNEKGTMFRHNEESWKKLWVLVGETTGTSWDVGAWLEAQEDFGQWKGRQDELDNRLDSGDRSLRFEVTRL